MTEIIIAAAKIRREGKEVSETAGERSMNDYLADTSWETETNYLLQKAHDQGVYFLKMKLVLTIFSRNRWAPSSYLLTTQPHGDCHPGQQLVSKEEAKIIMRID